MTDPDTMYTVISNSLNINNIGCLYQYLFLTGYIVAISIISGHLGISVFTDWIYCSSINDFWLDMLFQYHFNIGYILIILSQTGHTAAI